MGIWDLKKGGEKEHLCLMTTDKDHKSCTWCIQCLISININCCVRSISFLWGLIKFHLVLSCLSCALLHSTRNKKICFEVSSFQRWWVLWSHSLSSSIDIDIDICCMTSSYFTIRIYTADQFLLPLIWSKFLKSLSRITHFKVQ